MLPWNSIPTEVFFKMGFKLTSVGTLVTLPSAYFQVVLMNSFLIEKNAKCKGILLFYDLILGFYFSFLNRSFNIIRSLSSI